MEVSRFLANVFTKKCNLHKMADRQTGGCNNQMKQAKGFSTLVVIYGSRRYIQSGQNLW